MKIERVHPIETPYATLTVSAGEYDTIRNSLLWAQTNNKVFGTDWLERMNKLHEQLKVIPK